MKQTEENLRFQTKLQELLMEISNTYINLPIEQFDEKINISLKELGEFVNADRFYIFDYDFVKQTCTNTHEWCAKDIEPQIEYLQNVPLAEIPEWVNTHVKGDIMYIYDVASLNYEERLRQILELQGIKSLLTVPLMQENGCIGFVGFDSVKVNHEYSAEEVNLLKIFAKMIVNVKSRHKADSELLETNRKLNFLMNNLRGVAFRCVNNDSWTMDFISEGVKELTGFNSEDFILNKTRDFNSIIHEEDRQKVREEIQTCISAKTPYTVEYRIICADSSLKWVWEKGQGIYNEDELIALEGFITDITDLKKADFKLKQSEENYKNIFYNSPYGYLIISDGKFIDCNITAQKIIGGNKEQIIKSSPSDLAPEFQPNGRNSKEYAKELDDYALSYGDLNFDWVHKRFDGSETLTNITLTKITYEDREAILTTWKDITKSREAENQLRKLSMAVEQSPVSIVITDLDGNIEYINPKACETTGYSYEELSGKNPKILKSGETDDKEYSNLWDNITTGKVWKGILHNKRKDGGLYWESSTIAPITDEKGKIINFLAIKEDITHKRQIEQALINSEKRLSQIIENSQTVIWEVDTSGLYTYLSPLSSIVYGYSPEELIGKKYFYDVYPDDLKDEFKNEGLKIITSGKNLVNFENPIFKKDGSLIWVTTNGTPVYENGIIKGYLGADQDITARKLAQDELLKFRTISDQANYGTAIADFNGILIYVNDAFSRMHGYEAGELLGKPLTCVHSQNQQSRVKELLNLMKKNGGFNALEVGHMKKDGTEFPTLMSTKTIFNNQNVPLYYSATVIDTTQLKKNEAEIKKLSLAVEQSPVAILVTDLDSNIIYISPAFTRITGYTWEDIIGKKTNILKSGKTDASTYEELWETIKSGKTWYGEWMNKKKDKSIYWEKVSVNPITDESGAIINYMAIKEDITNRKDYESEILDLNINLERKIQIRTEELEEINKALLTKTEELEKFFSVALDLLCIANNEGYFIKVNKAWEQLLGFSVKEIEGSKFLDYIHPDDINNTYDIMTVLDNNETVRGFTNRYRTKSGEYRNIEWHSVEVNNLIYAAARDVTERVEFEKSLTESIEKEKELNELKSRFVSMASHEFRTPLASVMMSCETLISYWKRLDGEQIEAKLLNIKEQVKHLGGIVNNVMQVTKIQEGKIAFNPIEIDFVQLSRKIVTDFNSVSNLKNSITYKSDFETIPMTLDRSLMVQVLHNLISNAIKYSQPDPIIDIELKSDEVNIILSINDNGIGIPESDKNHLFEPFFRAGNVKNIEGNGLGLSIVKESIELHGGKISFYSNQNKGSEFKVYLPKTLILK